MLACSAGQGGGIFVDGNGATLTNISTSSLDMNQLYCPLALGMAVLSTCKAVLVSLPTVPSPETVLLVMVGAMAYTFKCFTPPHTPGAVLCCAVLCCAVLCCALLCPAVPCCALLCPAVPCCALLCPAVPCCALPCCALLCPAVPCRALPCCALLCCAVLCPVVLCCALLCCAVLESCMASNQLLP